ncbi:MAG TPA: ABC transporter permease [Solirubrobacteraceae bacterium]|nr:ABC transporter permease [Solirubrobacteraceae bacterium]
MVRFIVRRLLVMIGLLIVISMFTFAMFVLVLPNGNPAALLAGRLATPAEVHLIDVRYGFNQPIYIQYVDTMKNIFTGQAYSYQSGFNVLSEIRAGMPATLSLAIGAGIIWLATSILFGTIAAVKAGKYADRVLTVLSMIGVSMPPFFFGAVLIYYVAYKLNIIPIGGYVPLTQSVGGWFGHLIAPWITLSILFIGFYSRVLRSSILDSINEDYVRTARAKGLSERQVLIRHSLRNSLIPIFSLWGLDFAQVIGGGAILTETVFNLHGVGELARDSIGRLDTITLMAIVILTGIAVVVIGALVDVLVAFLDPRIRLQA